MSRLAYAFRLFWAVLAGKLKLERCQVLLEKPAGAPAEEQRAAAPPAAAQPKPAARSDAITLLATLQREARFVDLVMEPLDQYSDEQIGAAARDVLRGCGQVISRILKLKPVLNEAENSAVQTPAQIDAGRYRLVGSVSGDPPYRGRLVHHGWEADKCEMPAWTGTAESARIVAPAEIECD